MSLLAISASGAIQYWDPQGTTGANPYTGDLSGIWESNNWGSSSAGVATPTSWVDSAVSGSSVAAVIAVHAGTGTPPFTITLNTNHTVAGFFANGIVGGLFSTTTLQGPGVITIGPTSVAQPYTTLFANLQGILASSGTVLTIYNNIAGTLAHSGAITAESSGQIALFGTNTYSCGTLLGYSGTGFGGIIYITNADPTQGPICTSFGTATIGISNCQGGAIVAPTTEAITVTNPITVFNTPGQAVNLKGSPFGLTFSGPFSLGTNTLIVGAGDSGYVTIISGVISGSGSLIRGQANVGTLELNATNTFTGNVTCSNGVLALGPTGSISNVANIIIPQGGTFDVSAVPSPFSLSTSTTLNASGAGNPATIVGPSGGVVNLGAQPIKLTFDSADIPLTISQGELTLNGNQITINSTFQLGAGTYTMISVTGGTINGAPSTNVIVTGAGLAGGCLATLQVNAGAVQLVVTQGASDVWNGLDFVNNANWSDATNWVGTVAPTPFGDEVTFSGSVGLTPVMDSNYTVYSLAFDNTAMPFTLTASGGSVLSVSFGITNGSANLQTLALPVQMVDFGQSGPTSWDITAGPIAVTSVISDTGKGMSVTGGHTLTLSNANTYTGGTTINGGATVLANTIADANCSIGPSGAVTVGSNSALTYTGSSPASTSRTVTFSGGAANLNLPNGQTLTLSGSTKSASAGIGNLTGAGSTLILAGTVDDSSLGMTVGTGTTLVLNKAPSTTTVHALGGTTTTINSGGTLQVAGPGSFQIFNTGNLFENSGGLIDFDGQSDSFGTLTLQGTGISGSGALINSAASTTSFLTNSGGIILTNNTTIGGAGSPGNLYLASKITGTFPLTYAGTGLLMLAGPGTFSGGLTINSGCSVMVTSGGYTNGGAGVGTVTINSNGILILTNVGGFANTNVVGGSNTTMNILMAGGNLWLTNSLSNFVGTFNVSNLLNLSGAQLVVGSGSAISPHINASATWNIYPGVAIDFNGAQNDPAPVNLYGLPYASATLGALRLDNSTQSGPVILHGNSSIGGATATSNSFVTGVISETGGSFGFTMPGACRLSLTATNTYSGATAVNGGTLLLSGNGSISNSSSLSIAAGATFDVSGLNSTTFSLSSSTSLSASGKGTTVGTTAAAINGAASGGIVNLGAQPISLVFTPTNFTGDLTHPSLYVPQGALTLSGNTISVSNATVTPLGIGTYTLINVAGGVISGAPASAVTVTGAGLAPGTGASIQVSGGNVNLVVANAVVLQPGINAVSTAGGNVILSGTNGNINHTFYVLTTTNLALPLNQWTTNSTNAFSATGTFSVTNTNSPSPSYYIIQVPTP
jgi:autotransporter-associated beta strand protein